MASIRLYGAAGPVTRERTKSSPDARLDNTETQAEAWLRADNAQRERAEARSRQCIQFVKAQVPVGYTQAPE